MKNVGVLNRPNKDDYKFKLEPGKRQNALKNLGLENL